MEAALGVFTTGRLAAVRAGFGVLALLAPRLGIAVFGFPASHDSGTARLLGRLFGIRELVIAGLTLLFDDDEARRPVLYRLNAALDGSDAVVAAAAVVTRRGVDRAALSIVLVGGALAALWLAKAREAESSV